MAPHRKTPDESNAGTMLALLALLAVGGGLVGLTALVMPAALGFVAVVFGFFCFGAIHYLLWGWWMPRVTRNENDREENEGNR